MGKRRESTGPNCYPTFQVRPNGVLFYDQYVNPGKKTDKAKANQANLTRGDFNGYLSVKSKSICKRYLTNWIECLRVHKQHYDKQDVRQQITFGTLTLPSSQAHDDNFIKRECLDPFIATVKRKYGVVNYFWRAEAQKNGNIHFHVLLDKWIHHSKVRATWNALLKPHGYIAAYRANQLAHHANGFTMRNDGRSEEKQREAYKIGMLTDWQSPNSTDIKDPKKIKNVVAYITKYVTKDNTAPACDVDTHQDVLIHLDRPIQGRLWGCSDAIRELSFLTMEDLHGSPQVEPDSDNAPGRNELEVLIDAVEAQPKEKFFSRKGLLFIPFDVSEYMRKHCPWLYDRYATHYLQYHQKIYGRLKIPDMPPTAPLELYEKNATEYLLF